MFRAWLAFPRGEGAERSGSDAKPKDGGSQLSPFGRLQRLGGNFILSAFNCFMYDL